jgi:predicted component of type VI protein secretion system
MISLFDRIVSENCPGVGRQLDLNHLRRDIENLLNHPRELFVGFDDGFLSQSVLCYGLPSFAGKRIESSTLDEIAQCVGTTLCRFEPRLDPGSIVVRRCSEVSGQPGVLVFAVNARLRERANDIRLQLNFDVNFGRAEVLAECHF